ncbi:MAG: sigma-70 family RNA polymerase sigma factor, partial [Clostridiaceae bacterium]|nr:sigma-70 family RNA polymerase sigma factor [Clostridiaceae bacterium]
TFDNTKEIRLVTYASRCIENEILMHIRSCLKIKSEVSLEFPIGSDKNGNGINLLDILGTDIDCVHDEVESNLLVNSVFELIELILDDRERLIIKLRYCLNGKRKTQGEIAKALGISRSYVSRIERKSLNKLKKALQAEKIN